MRDPRILYPLPLTYYSLLFLTGFVVLATIHTWPLASHLSSRIPHDPGDPILNTWILWWNAQALPFTREWWSPPIFYPLQGGLALSEHLAGLSPFATPLILAGATPIAAYNVALILSYALSAFFAWLLVLRLTGSRLAAVFGGLAYGFAPYRAGQIAHLQVLTSQWMPLMLLALHGYVDTRRRKWLFVFGVAWVLQALSNGYYLLFVPVLILLWLAWFVDWRRDARAGAAIVAAWTIASLALVPTLIEYRKVHGELALTRTIDEIRGFSADAASFTQSSPMLRVRPGRADKGEQHLYPGVTVPALIVAAIAAAILFRRRLPGGFVFYSVAAAVLYLFACGPARPDDGIAALLRPYTLLTYLPGFSGLRVPTRFGMIATLAACVAASLAFAALEPRSRHLRAGFAAMIFLGVAVDGVMRPMPLFSPPARVPLPDVANAAVIELPPDNPSVSVSAMYRSMFHRRPLINGYSGHVPPHYTIMATALRRDDPSPLLHLARGRSLVVVIDDRRDTGGDFRRLVQRLPGVQRHQATSAGEVFVVPPLPPEPAPARGTMWPSTVQVGPQGRRIDLGDVRTIRTIEFPMRERYITLYTRMTFEVSTDGELWSPVWEDWTGGAALAAALRDAREAPVRLTLPDATARYLRFAPGPDWLWRELRVFGP